MNLPAMLSLPFRLTVLLASVVLTGCQPRSATAPTHPSDSRWHRYVSVKPKMGTVFRIVFYADDEHNAQAATDAIWARIDQLNAILSDYDPNSELSRVCQMTNQGPMTSPVPISDDFYKVLARSIEVSQATEGAFDATIGPCVRLWRRSRELGQLPTPRRIATARESIGFEKVKLDPAHHTVQLLATHMRLDFGAIAKGYTAQEGARLLAQRGISRALVGAAGDIYAGDPPPGRVGWRIAFEEPGKSGATTGRYVQIRNAAISTSGDTYRFVEIEGKRYSHIIDPRTGMGITRRIGVSVIALDGMTSDSFGTAMSILGPAKAMALADRTPGLAAMVTSFDSSGEPAVVLSSRFANFLVDAASEPADTTIEID